MIIPNVPRSWHISNGILLVAGLAAVAATWPAFPAPQPVMVGLFALFGIVTNLSLIPVSGATVVVLSDAAFLATSLIFGPPTAAFVITAAVAAGELARARPTPPVSYRLSRLARNVGMYMLMSVAATALYVAAQGDLPLEHLDVANYLAALGFMAVYEIINRALIYHQLYVRGLSIRNELASEVQMLPIEVLTLHMGLLIALTYTHNGFGPLTIFGAFIFFFSFLMQRYVSQLQQRVAQLGALNEIGRAISATVDIGNLLCVIWRESSKVIDTTNFYIALGSKASSEVTFVLDVNAGVLNTTPETRRGGNGLTEYVIRTAQPLWLAGNVTAQARERGIEPTDQPALCWLGVPLIADDKVLGMMAAQSYTSARAFQPDQIAVLGTIAAQAAVAIQNARLVEAVAQQERLRQELALARQIQQNLLPPPPTVPGLYIASCCLPAQETGGDLFDFIRIDEHHLGIAIGDVVGKGMPAALLMATVRSVLRAYAQHHTDPGAVLEAVNRVMYDDTRGKTYVSLCYVVLDTREWSFTFASAGHLSPLLCDPAAAPVYLENPGCLPLGINPATVCANYTYTLQPEQALLLYTDGVIEAHNAGNQMLSFEGLQAMTAQQPTERLIEVVVDGVMRYAGSAALEDDLTLVLIKRQ